MSSDSLKYAGQNKADFLAKLYFTWHGLYVQLRIRKKNIEHIHNVKSQEYTGTYDTSSSK